MKKKFPFFNRKLPPLIMIKCNDNVKKYLPEQIYNFSFALVLL